MKLYNHVTPRLSDLEERRLSRPSPRVAAAADTRRAFRASGSDPQAKRRTRPGPHDLLRSACLDKPAYTISTYFSRIGNGAFLHPGQRRLISLREGARLQSFPDHVRFFGPRRAQYESIGNAVPPLLGYAVGCTLPRGAVADLFAGAGVCLSALALQVTKPYMRPTARHTP